MCLSAPFWIHHHCFQNGPFTSVFLTYFLTHFSYIICATFPTHHCFSVRPKSSLLYFALKINFKFCDCIQNLILIFQYFTAMSMKMTDCLLECCTMQPGRNSLTFQRYVLLDDGGSRQMSVSFYNIALPNIPEDKHCTAQHPRRQSSSLICHICV
jgi:hypothetical protein